MFSFKKKIDSNLKSCILSRPNTKYRVLIKYKKFQDSIAKRVASKGELLKVIEPCSLICANLNSRAIERLLEYPEIEYICFDEYLSLCGTSVVTSNKLRLPHKSNITGKGVDVAFIDSGVYPHPDLITPYNRIVTFVDLINNISHPYDDNGHGTCTAGIIGGNGEKSNGMYKGVATECNLHCYKAFDKSGKGYISDVLYAMDMIYKDTEKHSIKILCMPFELLRYNTFLQNNFDIMAKRLNDKNITCIVPSGSNKNFDGSITGIALSNFCLTISGYDSSSGIKPYSYSSSGALKKDSKPNFCASCVDIVSLNSDSNYISERDGIKLYPTKLNSSYKSFTGTSLAAAYICGICALLYHDNPELNSKDISSLLSVSCEKLDMADNYQGNGKVNISSILK